jgi:hypothetical protein
MKIIAIAIKTKPLEVLTLGMASFLEELLMDKRLKKAEAIKAYRASDAYKAKRTKYQKYHAEYGQIAEIAIMSDDKVGVREGENKAFNFLEQELKGAGRIVGFDLRWQLQFILRRRYLTGATGPLRSMLFTNDGTATTATTDIKMAWTQNDKSYSGLTLADLCRYSGCDIPPTTETEALQVMRIYEDMEGSLL